MEDKIEVNEYVRTKEGFIYRIEDGEEFFEDSVDVGIGIIPDVEGIWVDKEHLNYIDKRDIKKHSKNLIDLIKPGELIETEYGSGWFHHKIDEKSFLFDDGEEFIEVKNENLISILTHEQYEANCYKVGENDEKV